MQQGYREFTHEETCADTGRSLDLGIYFLLIIIETRDFTGDQLFSQLSYALELIIMVFGHGISGMQRTAMYDAYCGLLILIRIEIFGHSVMILLPGFMANIRF